MVNKRLFLVVLILVFVSSFVFATDDYLVYPYSKTLDVLSDVTQYTSLIAPAFIAIASNSLNDSIKLSVAYGSTILLTYATRTIVKETVVRNRPYTTFGDFHGDYNKSFFSGHSALAFASAAFTQTVFSQKYKESKWKTPVTITTWSLAATTAILRVASGSHYLSDVVVGSLVGSLFGFAIPFIANKISPTWQIGVGPNTVAFNVTY